MPLGFVYVQKPPDLVIKSGVYALKSFGKVLMYSAFGNSELFGGGSDGGFVFDDIFSQVTGALLYICVHIYHSLISRDICI